MNKQVKWFIFHKKQDEKVTQLSFLEELQLSPVHSKDDRVVEEFNTFNEAKVAFTFYKSLLSK